MDKRTVKVSDLGEFGLIDCIKGDVLFEQENVVAGIGDDAAILKHPSGKLLLATTDMMIENVHFLLKENNGHQIGYRVMAANVSDIAAMGGKPTHALISIGVKEEAEVVCIEDIYKGIKSCCREFRINIVGGDTVFSPNNLIINVMLLGTVQDGKYLLRSGACPGDLIIVTGYLGDSSAGVDVLLNNYGVSKSCRDYLMDRHYYPTPRVREIASAMEVGRITAADDISDGLASELHEIAFASNVGVLIHSDKLPVSEQAREASRMANRDVMEYALFGGEDFEIVFTAPPEQAMEVAGVLEKKTGTKATIVGEILDSSKGINISRDGITKPLDKKGYDHFRKVL